MRHAGPLAGSRSQSPLGGAGSALSAAVLTAPEGLTGDDLRLTSGMRLTPAFGVQVGHRRVAHDVPAFGTPEHLALMSGSLDLDEVERAAAMGPLVGFAPIVLDPRGPSCPDEGSGRASGQPRVLPVTLGPGEPVAPCAGVPLTDGPAAPGRVVPGSVVPGSVMDGPVASGAQARAAEGPRGAATGGPQTSATRVLPSRRSLRAAAAPASLGRPLADGVLPGSAGSALPVPRGTRPGRVAAPFAALAPSARYAAQVAPTTGALRVKDVEQALAACPAKAPADDPTPTGELARPFVDENAAPEWSGLQDVPPPVSVDVFQRAVRAGLALEDADRLDSLDEEAQEGGRRGCARSRRELRARERATTSTRSVTARRLAKGGVLAITALGVVSGATPQGLHAFGMAKDSTSSRNTIDFASSIATESTAPVLSASQLDQARRSALNGFLQTEIAQSKVSDAVRAGALAGTGLAELGQEQDQRMIAEREAARQRAIRDAINNPQEYARLASLDRGWGAGQFECLSSLWTKESGWSYTAQNPSSGAYGIAQALPGSRMNVVGADWRTNPITQIKWGLNYIADRYGTPCGAWAHSQETGWY